MLLERVLPLLEQVVAGLPADVGLLTAISDAIPYPSAALAEADLAVTRRILAGAARRRPGAAGPLAELAGYHSRPDRPPG